MGKSLLNHNNLVLSWPNKSLGSPPNSRRYNKSCPNQDLTAAMLPSHPARLHGTKTVALGRRQLCIAGTKVIQLAQRIHAWQNGNPSHLDDGRVLISWAKSPLPYFRLFTTNLPGCSFTQNARHSDVSYFSQFDRFETCLINIDQGFTGCRRTTQSRWHATRRTAMNTSPSLCLVICCL